MRSGENTVLGQGKAHDTEMSENFNFSTKNLTRYKSPLKNFPIKSKGFVLALILHDL